MRIITLLPLAAAVLSVAGCGSISNPIYGESGIINDRSQNYEKSESTQRLELPPSLQARSKQMEDRLNVPSAGQTASVRTSDFEVPRPEFFYADAGSEKVNLKRENGDKILIIDEPVGDVWIQLQDFLRLNDVVLAKSAPREGVLETDWIDSDGKEYSFIDSLIKQLTFQDVEGAVSDKLQISVRPMQDDYNRTSIAMKHVRVAQDEKSSAVDWSGSAQDVGYKSDMMFEILRYLSKSSNDVTTQSALAKKQRQKARPQLGRDSKGFPALKVTAPVDQAWDQIDSALTRSGLDIGTRNQGAGIFYMTYTTSTPFDEVEKMGFFEWLHSDRKEIKFGTGGVASALGFDDDKNKVSYSSKATEYVAPPVAAEPIDPLKPVSVESLIDNVSAKQEDAENYTVDAANDPANKPGYKVWFGGKVIYVFGEEEGGVFNSDTGSYEHVGQYQLKMNRTASGVFLTVKTPEGYSAPAVIADEILWQIKDNI